ncbi:High mobility group protein hmg-12 [Caenorhabditis elegans]|uniref:High mobility group protein hmg-12 n=1 Tax=Caenorhabditis elegans TaxID=6239 RepID=HMG12_CAEEL|nr:High mobility group protein hmg-12 [Caenorhabditis elegans]G5EDQ2.1 RecName: Full=High mobility group protein hmg-12; AltName: Full=High mobility group AT-hook protein hmg-12; AltName: Full=High mobility group protein I beta [Caenorhabditis elegans]AAC78601.1 high mobility group protein I beta [Caenorhabditis elegans]CAA15962.1 High mobility group protein hmg-12 [Caenorhabditis elegans]|eukprot:NP_496544.1 HMG [Caenorhabditis elegans]
MSDVAEEKAEFLVIRTYGSESFRKECADLIEKELHKLNATIARVPVGEFVAYAENAVKNETDSEAVGSSSVKRENSANDSPANTNDVDIVSSPVKRGRGRKAKNPSADADVNDTGSSPVKKGRGRPIKNPSADAGSPLVKKGRGRRAQTPAADTDAIDTASSPVKKGRGRPAKNPSADAGSPLVKKGRGRQAKNLAADTDAIDTASSPVKKGRGRPLKKTAAEADVNGLGSPSANRITGCPPSTKVSNQSSPPEPAVNESEEADEPVLKRGRSVKQPKDESESDDEDAEKAPAAIPKKRGRPGKSAIDAFFDGSD